MAKNFNISWTVPTSDGGSPITSYDVGYTPSGSGETIVSTASASSSYVLAGLTDGVEYSVRVRAVNAAGAGPWSDPVVQLAAVVPYAPTWTQKNLNPYTSQDEGIIQLEWDPPSNDGGSTITGYIIRYTEEGQSPLTVETNSTNTTFSLTELNTIASSYTVEVAAINSIGIGTYSSPVVTPFITITEQPVSQTAVGGEATFSVTATVTQDAALTYVWFVQVGGTGLFQSIIPSERNATLSLSGLTAQDNGNVYKCLIFANEELNFNEVGLFSDTATLTVPAEASEPLMLLRSNSNWGPTDEGPNNYYLYNWDYVDETAPNIAGRTPYGNYLLYTTAMAGFGPLSGPFSSSPLFVDNYNYHSTASDSATAQDLLSQMNGDFTIEFWAAYYTSSDPTQGSPTNLEQYTYERFFTIGNIEFGTVTQYEDDIGYVVLGYKTVVAPANTIGNLTGYQNIDPDVFVATPMNNNMYNGTFSNAIASAGLSDYVHIAIVRDTNGATYSDELRFYMDGSLVGTADLTSSGWNWGATAMSSSQIVNFSAYAWGFYPTIFYDDFRITDTVVYSGSTITVPSSAHQGARSAASANTELLLHCDGGPADYGVNKYYVSLDGLSTSSYMTPAPYITLDTTNKKFGSASYYFDRNMGADGAGFPSFGLIDQGYGCCPTKYLPSDLLTKLQNANQYTIEMWIRPTSTMPAIGEAYWSIGSINYDPYLLITLMDGSVGPLDGFSGTTNTPYSSGLRLVITSTAGNTEELSISTNSLTRDVWSHVAVTYNNGIWRLKVNGSEAASTISISSFTNSPISFTNFSYTAICIGALFDDYNALGPVYDDSPYSSWIDSFTGNIDEIRFSSVDRYGSGSYTVPTAAFS